MRFIKSNGKDIELTYCGSIQVIDDEGIPIAFCSENNRPELWDSWGLLIKVSEPTDFILKRSIASAYSMISLLQRIYIEAK